jgi:cytochrome oxidase Cu insertion factor (SCO1/SenC/PrrC family)
MSNKQTSVSLLLAATLLLALVSMSGITASAQGRSAAIIYECPMHPDVTTKRPGRCSKCGMTLKATKQNRVPAAATNVSPVPEKGDGAAGSNGSTVQSKSDKDIESASASAAKYFPNLLLRTQDNQAVHFYDDLLKGKVVLINFIFTSCQGVCSPMTANLARAQSYLAEHLGKEVVMISISVDPLNDTPEVLRQYAEKFKVKPGWYFLTGEKKNVDWVLYKLGGYVTDKQQHTSVLIIGNEMTGEWLKINAMATPTDIASAVTKLLASKPDPATP